jgi:hypothetical protein
MMICGDWANGEWAWGFADASRYAGIAPILIEKQLNHLSLNIVMFQVHFADASRYAGIAPILLNWD